MRRLSHKMLLGLTVAAFFALLSFSGCKKEKRVSTTSAPIPAVSPLPRLDLALLEAAGKGDTVAVKGLLEKGVDVNVKVFDGRTALMEAAYTGQIETARLLLDHGADLSPIKKDGANALALAGGHKEIAALFANVGKLVAAAGKGEKKFVRELVDNGTPINGFDVNGHSAMTEASWNGQTEIVKLLLQKGANPSLKKSDGATPIELAKGRNHKSIVDLLSSALAKQAAAQAPSATPAAQN